MSKSRQQERLSTSADSLSHTESAHLPGRPPQGSMGNAARQEQLKLGQPPNSAPLGDGGYASAPPPGDGDRAAIEAAVASSPGRALEPDLMATASQGLGRSMADVTVHEGAPVDLLLAKLGMRALTWGTAILRTNSGAAQSVMLHELVHVAQHDGKAPSGQAGVSTGASGGQAEVEADVGAQAIASGASLQVARQAPAARGFGATAPVTDGVRDRSAVCHENQTVDSATDAGFTTEEANNIYSGNWQRDMNQLLMPALEPLNPCIYEILSIAHTKHFGTPLPGPGEMGTYDPVEHIDNPGGLVGSGVYNQNGDTAASTTTMGTEEPLASLDPRYLVEAYAAQVEGGRSSNGVRGDGSEPGEATENPAFQVDQSGIPMYLRASRTQLMESLVGAVNLSRQPDGRSRGLRMVGEALHVMQDFYAHSNFCEIGINILLQERHTTRYDAEGRVDANGRTLEEIFAASGHSLGEFNLDSLVHEISTDREDGREVHDDENLTHNGREVMTTGTFMVSDSLHSLKEKLLGLVEDLNPFRETTPGPSEWTIAVFSWMQSNPTFVSGVDTSSIAGRIRAVGPALRTVTDGAGAVVGGVGTVAENVAGGAGEIGGAVVDASILGVGYQLATGERAGDSLRNAGHSVGSAVSAETTAITQGLDHLNQSLEEMAVNVETLSLAEVYRHAYSVTSPWLRLSTWAREIPLVGDALADEIRVAENVVRDMARALLANLWDVALRQVIAEVDALVSASLGSTEVTAGNGAQTMTQPTHTDIAKDFDQGNHGTHDSTSVIEEVTEWARELGNEGGETLEGLGESARELPVVGEPLSGLLVDLGEGMESDHMDRDLDEPHQHQHRHGGAWLAGLANGMAHSSSRAILGVVRAQMDAPGATEADVQREVGSVVNGWMAHPEDCRGTWMGSFVSALQGQDASTEELLAEISRRTASPPSQQAPNMHQASDGAGADSYHDHNHDDDHANAPVAGSAHDHHAHP